MLGIAAHLSSNDTLLWVNFILNLVEGIALAVVLFVGVRWARRMSMFMDLMNEMSIEERMLRSRLEEWQDSQGGFGEAP